MTTKQELAIQKTLENNGNVGKAMIEAGYSKASAKNPSILTKSKGYKLAHASLMKQHNVTLDKYIENIGLAMNAALPIYEENPETKEMELIREEPIIALRLQGNKQAERLLFGDDDKTKPARMDMGDLKALADESDEVKLSELVFKKN